MEIVRVEASHQAYPFRGYFKFLGTAGHQVVTVRIVSDDGSEGWGQSVFPLRWSYETPEVALVLIGRYFGPALLGQDPREIVALSSRLDEVLAPGFTQGYPLTRASLDLALHDLAGKLLGQPVWRLWGCPPPQPVMLSWTVNVTSLADAEVVVEQGRQLGYRHFNLKVAPDVKFDVELARIVRQMAPECFLWADANGGYTLESAKQAARLLAEVGVDVLEAPLRPHMIQGYRQLRRLGALPIIMDEGVITPRDLIEFIRLEMMDGLAVKLSRSGGLLATKRQLEIILDAGLLALGSGLTDPDVSLAGSLALFGAFRLRFPAALNGPQFLSACVLKQPLRIENGLAYAPEGPGLGVAVDPKMLQQLSVPAAPPLATNHVVVEK
jgi:L-alanine-DL-glutamate epimerase-like enolase superfamily enzyme